jgi:hypothetical protein
MQASKCTPESRFFPELINLRGRLNIMTTYGRDTPMERPNPGGRAAVFVPHPQADEAVAAVFSNGSGITGFGNPDGTLTVYFENNKFRDAALSTWESKVFKAYLRMVERLPTVNKVTCNAADLEHIGFIQGPEILVRDMQMLEAWLKRSGAGGSMPESEEIRA